MLPLNPQTMMKFSSSDVDVILAALYDFVETDFSEIWSKKQCCENRQIALRVIKKFENKDTDFTIGEIELSHVALCFLGEYLECLPENELTSSQKQLIALFPYVQSKLTAILDCFSRVKLDSDGN